MQSKMINKAIELLQNGTVDRVIGWKIGDVCYDVTPAVFNSAEEIQKDFVFNDFCGANLSKYLIKESRKGGKILAFLKPCDTYSFNQLVKEHRIIRENVYVVGVQCDGMALPEYLRNKADSAILSVSSDGKTINVETVSGSISVEKNEILAERCACCKSKKLVAYDEIIGENGQETGAERFDEVAKIEGMTPDERFAFWQNELSRCIRCNACRNVCPACSCEKCVFDNDDLGTTSKAPSQSFEENMFHIIRAFHVAGRCTDCGECSRVCPEHIPIHLLNRKFIKDINELYGEFQAGEDTETNAPLTSYTFDDAEPSVVEERGNN